MFGHNDKEPDLEFFTVFDSKTKSYAEPFPAKNKDTVLRDFMNAFKNPEASTKNKYYINAEDYSLFRIGAFDHRSGKLSAQNAEHVVNFHDIRAMLQPENSPRALSST